VSRRIRSTPSRLPPRDAADTVKVSRPASRAGDGAVLSPEVDFFRRVYVVEQRAANSAVQGRRSTYSPAKEQLERRDGECVIKTVESVWSKKYRSLLSHHLQPEQYLRVLFYGVGGTAKPPPTPQQLDAESYREIYRETQKTLFDQVQCRLRSQASIGRTQARLACDDGESVEDAVYAVVCDSSLPLSPLFRYCLASSQSGDRFRIKQRQLELPAALQFTVCPAIYSELLGKSLPDEFAARAAKLFRRHCLQLDIR